ncbi:MAG: DUF2784 domain-containing protein [Magnetococcus sp. MYC-9]
MSDRWLADGVLCFHLLFVVFVLGGGWLVRRWPRLAWLHLPCVAWGVAVEVGGWNCPLTLLEDHWRSAGQQAGDTPGFVEQFLRPLLYPELWVPGGVPAWGFALLGCGVLLLNLGVYAPLWRQRLPFQGALLSPPHRPPPTPTASAYAQSVAAPPPSSATPSPPVRGERRDAIRIPYAEATDMVLQIKSQEGNTLDVVLLELGIGGCSFLFPDEEPFLPEGALLELTFHWCVDQRLSLPGNLLRVERRSEVVTGHLLFSIDTPEAERALGALVTWMERIHLRARHNWSATETENLAALYRNSGSHSCACARC